LVSNINFLELTTLHSLPYRIVLSRRASDHYSANTLLSILDRTNSTVLSYEWPKWHCLPKPF